MFGICRHVRQPRNRTGDQPVWIRMARDFVVRLPISAIDGDVEQVGGLLSFRLILKHRWRRE